MKNIIFPYSVKPYLVYLTVTLSASLLGCAGNPLEDDVLDERFITEIKADGSKLFTYGVSFDLGNHNKGDRTKANDGGWGQGDNRQRGNGGQRSGNGREQGSGNMPMNMGRQNSRSTDNQQDMLEALYSRLELKLAKSGYCREGYFELDRYTSSRTSQIKGECNESASEKDRAKFKQ